MESKEKGAQTATLNKLKEKLNECQTQMTDQDHLIKVIDSFANCRRQLSEARTKSENSQENLRALKRFWKREG